MHVEEETDDRLVLRDTQLDKQVGTYGIMALLLFTAFIFAKEGEWIIPLFLGLVAVAAFVYLKFTILSATLTFDRAADRVSLSVKSRKHSEDWDWTLGEIAAAEVDEVLRSDDMPGNGLKRPVLVLLDGTRVPARPYHSAGGQSWDAVIAIRKFIGQDKTDDLPVGRLSDD